MTVENVILDGKVAKRKKSENFFMLIVLLARKAVITITNRRGLPVYLFEDL